MRTARAGRVLASRIICSLSTSTAGGQSLSRTGGWLGDCS